MDRTWRLTGTVFGPGLLRVRVGRHFTLAMTISFPGAFGPAHNQGTHSGKEELERRVSEDVLPQILIRRKRLIFLGNCTNRSM